jgi:hypothetical protein
MAVMEQTSIPSSTNTQVRHPNRNAQAPIVEKAEAMMGLPTANTVSFTFSLLVIPRE